jgi:mono/diheme cytochrome c family protein
MTCSAKRSQSLGWLLALAPLLAFLPGCGSDNYSESMIYPVRSDPLITDTSEREFPEPDRPGQLPLMNFKDIDDSRNPFHQEAKDPKFKYVDPKKLTRDDRQELEDVLQDVFGTPANPEVGMISAETRNLLQLDKDTLKEGSRLYRLYCLQCHGLTGDGRGPTSKWVNPHPRDYRLGLFKFQSVDQKKNPNSPPRRDDLYRTIHEGVEGTAMQSYNMLPEPDLNALVSYVIHLSIRGQAEAELLKATSFDSKKNTLTFGKGTGGEITAFVKGKRNTGGMVREIAEAWREAQEDTNKIVPDEAYRIKDGDLKALAESSQRGYDIFAGRGPVVGGCATCHFDFGRKSPYKFDKWGTMVKPRDLTQSVYRGGRRPIDFYYRIHSGINGSGMPSHANTLKADQIWDVVNFVRALPFPEMRKHLRPVIE